MENLIYFGKVSLLLTLFWLVYSFLLQKESFKNFNRWFLISGIGISFVLPFFTFTKVVEIPMIESSQFSEVIVPYASLGNREENQLRHNLDLPQMLFLIYLLGAIAMSLKLLFQLHSLRQLARKCAKQKIEGITHYFSLPLLLHFHFLKAFFTIKKVMMLKAFT